MRRLSALALAAALGCSTSPSGSRPADTANASSGDTQTEDPVIIGDDDVLGADAGVPDAPEAPDAQAFDDAPEAPDTVELPDTASVEDLSTPDADAPDTTSPSDDPWLATELLSRPHANGITLSLVPAAAVQVAVDVWPDGGAPKEVTTAPGTAGQPLTLELQGLEPDTAYHYRVRHRPPGAAEWATRPERRFHTRRAPGSTFVFTVQADSHLDEKSSVPLYHQTLDLAAAATPDFHLDLGDTFMCEKHSAPLTAEVVPAASPEIVDARYLSEREHFGRIAHSAPLFLVNGNHEGETGFLLDGTADNLAIWAAKARTRYYPGPEANGTYTSSATAPEPFVGVRQHPYAWQWGDALFVVIDPFWYTTKKAQPTNRWAWTLGDAQYAWLRDTLLNSTAAYKFVFAHHIVGGNSTASRGGVEAAPYFEWGGKELDGTDTFAANRPGWDEPVHALFVAAGVSAFFHGHDHVYVAQTLDGVVYQEVPQPSATNQTNGEALAAEGGYASGVVRSSSGHLRVTVTPEQALVEYVRSVLPGDEAALGANGAVAHSYTIHPGQPTVITDGPPVEPSGDTCAAVTKSEGDCKNCCDCSETAPAEGLPALDCAGRIACREDCMAQDATHWAAQAALPTFKAPSELGPSGDYSTCLAAGTQQACKACCECDSALLCGDFRYCRTACAALAP